MSSFLKYRNVILIALISLISLFIIKHGNSNYSEGMETAKPTKKEKVAKTDLKTMQNEVDILKIDLDKANKRVETAQKSKDALHSQIETKQIEIDKLQNELDVAQMNKSF